jgi:DNA-binding beta-propeller fold protein YncE
MTPLDARAQQVRPVWILLLLLLLLPAARRCRRCLALVPLIWLPPVATPSPIAAGAASQKTIAVAAWPIALADDPRTGRVFVVTIDPVTRFNAAVVDLDASSGRVLATIPLVVPHPRGKAGSGRRLPVSESGIAVDERSGRVFVLSGGLPGAPNSATKPPADMFMFDGTSGKLLAITSLKVRFPVAGFPPAVVVDARTNRVFSVNGDTNSLSVLDATTGQLLHTVVFPNHQSPPEPSPAVPLGVDGRDGWVLVNAPDGPVAVDERTGKAIHAIRLPDSQVLWYSLVDGRRGRAVLAVASEHDDAVDFADETIALATGKVVGEVYGGETQADHLLAIDERFGRVVVVNESTIPPEASVIDDTTGSFSPAMGLVGTDPNFMIAGAVNPVTGHALVVAASDPLVGPIFLQVQDMRTGKQLAMLRVAGAPNGYGCSVAVDGPTRHVFVGNPSLSSVTMYDATKL